MRVKNNHTAPVAGIAPGKVGDVDERNPGIRVFLDAEHLTQVGDSTPTDTGPTYERLLAAQREIIERTAQTLAQAQMEQNGAIERRMRELHDVADTRGSEIAAELEAAKARIAELEAASSKRPGKKTDPTTGE